MTVRRNIGFGLATQRRPRDEIARRVDEALAWCAWRRKRDKLPGQLSGGQQQRVAIARAIVVGAAAGADGRAAVQPRRQAAAGDARRDPAHPQHARLLHDLRDARPGGGAVARRPHRGDDRRARRARSARRRSCIPARRMPTSPSSWATATCSRSPAERRQTAAMVSVAGARACRHAGRSRSRAQAIVAIRPEDLHAGHRRADRRHGGDRRISRPRLLRRGARRRTAPSSISAPTERGRGRASVRLTARARSACLVYRAA